MRRFLFVFFDHTLAFSINSINNVNEWLNNFWKNNKILFFKTQTYLKLVNVQWGFNGTFIWASTSSLIISFNPNDFIFLFSRKKYLFQESVIFKKSRRNKIENYFANCCYLNKYVYFQLWKICSKYRFTHEVNFMFIQVVLA